MIPATAATDSRLKGDFHQGYIWIVCVVVALGGLLFGWDWVVIGGAKPFFESYFKLRDPALVGWANSCALVGCLAGAIAAGALSDKFGRRRLLILAALLFAVTSLGNALSPTFAMF
ncbi:MAG TPA: MFS transporter, partial [Opitutaceae bacterium]|nr:MFS transporter [Opitutaceae bacterium]